MMGAADAPPINRQTAPHYTWAGSCDGWRLMDMPGLSVIEERMPPGTQEVRHLHRMARQLFYVLEGELSMLVGDRMHRLGPSDAMPVAPSQAHQARNDSDSDVRFLVISAPSTTADRELA